MEKQKNVKQSENDTFEFKVLTSNNSCVAIDHTYKVRKSIRNQNLNPLQMHKNSNSSTTNEMTMCKLCNKTTQEQVQKFCNCFTRSFHLNCLLNYIYENIKQGTGIMKCSYCGLYYPTDIQSKYSIINFSKKEKIIYFLMFIILIMIIVAILIIICIFNFQPLILTVLIICLIIPTLLIIYLIRKSYLKLQITHFIMKEYKYGDEIIQFIYAKNAKKIMQSLNQQSNFN